LDMQDSDPSQIRGPFGDHDAISGNTDDFAGVLLDSRNDGKTALELFVNPHNIQFDAVIDDATGNEDASPDFFWDSAAKKNDHGWTLEMRVPYSSLRYTKSDPQTWGVIFYRNWPRERRYQMFTHQLPRGGNCLVCNFNKVTGLTGLPAGNHLVAAPYITARQVGAPRGGELGNDIVTRPIAGDLGMDVKWSPTADTVLDATINPDFSQIESDVAVISTNERFAIFIPEKRPFFLEGVELFSTPIQAVYTRTITSPRWGARTTGKIGDNAYTLLIAQDRGGGSIILPSALGSDFADQDFSSLVAIGRVRHDFGKSFASFLVTTREAEGGAHNRVFGPDFQWRIGDGDTLTGQLLYSTSENPNRPDLNPRFDGSKESGHAGDLWYSHSSPKFDFYSEVKDYGDEFRADNGFVPQTGYRSNYTEAGYTWRPKGFFNRVRGYAFGEYDEKQDGSLLYRLASVGFGADGRFRSFTRIRVAKDAVRTYDPAQDREVVLSRDRLYYQFDFSPSRVFTRFSFNGWIGDEIDFTNARLGRGADVNLTGTIRPTDHLQLALTNGVRWLNVHQDRLFTAQIERVRATYTFNSRMFVRAIVQNERTNRDVNLYGGGVDQHTGDIASQLLFAYKLNWQTVFYTGYGDLREATTEEGQLEPSERQFFAKVSYAFQR
ncbi:MAG TPA: DUF5916 domain-containing protein, partial [Thermoanaerobaculia bacterium]|nr:DUF5916 domain-containing protein [Thermoanaerobaculia bacterium]